MKQKLTEWLRRYGPAEAISLAATLLAAWLADGLGTSRLGIAAAGTLAGNAGYFGTILIQDIYATREALAAEGRHYTGKILFKNIRALVIEFGVAEMFDTLVIRPFLLYQMPLWMGSLTGGTVAAKFIADITFYVPAILFYEWSKRRNYRRF